MELGTISFDQILFDSFLGLSRTCIIKFTDNADCIRYLSILHNHEYMKTPHSIIYFKDANNILIQNDKVEKYKTMLFAYIGDDKFAVMGVL